MASLPECFLRDECRADLRCEHLFKCREYFFTRERLRKARESVESSKEILQTDIADTDPATTATAATTYYRATERAREELDRRSHAATATRGTPLERGGLRAHQSKIRSRVGDLETTPD